MGHLVTVHFPKVRTIYPPFWAREEKSYQANGYLPFEVPIGADLAPVDELQGLRKYADRRGYLLFAIAYDLCEARGLRDTGYVTKSLYHGNKDRIYFDETMKDGEAFAYHVKPGTTLNVGVLWSNNDPYALYRNATDEIFAQVKANIETAKGLSIFEWKKKVEGDGEWDYKHSKTKMFDGADFRSWNFSSGSAKSKFFYMKGFSYDSKMPNLLRYDDVGNINYGATGQALQGVFGKNKRIHLDGLLKAAGHKQQYDDKLISKWTAMFKMFLDANGYVSLRAPSLENMDTDKIMKHVEEVNKNLHSIRGRLRNEYGDDPRDSWAIAWGMKEFESLR